MNLIVAVDLNWGIGNKNELLYHIPEDMKFFRSVTLGKCVVCGKKTLQSFPEGKPLPNRKHFVLTHGQLEENENLKAIHSLEELFSAISQIPEDDVLVIGGDSVYRQLYPYCKRAFVTKIFENSKKADTYFPDLSRDESFVLESSSEILTSKNGIRYQFLTYLNKKK